jgi:hypothetical protein
VYVIDVNTVPHGNMFTDQEKEDMLNILTDHLVTMREIKSLEGWN